MGVTPDGAMGEDRASVRLALRRIRRGAWVSIGLVLMIGGLITVWIPFTLHSGGVFVVLGLVMVLRNSRRSRRWFIVWRRRHPRWGAPLRRLLKKKPEVAPVVWHELLRAERLIPPRFRCLRRARLRWFRRRPTASAGLIDAH